jgi:hypothetical protein
MEVESMKRAYDIKRCWLLLLCLTLAASTFADVIPTPRDPATIEALISLHKLIKGEEDKALAKVTTSFGEQSIITKGATKFNNVRTTLDSKLNNGYSYVILAGALGSTANSMYRLIQEYSQFTRSTFQYTFKKPMVAWYYIEANMACAREIKNIKTLYATLTASGINVMKASMDERLHLIMELRTSIENMRGIIDSANVWCSLITVGGFRYDYIWDILNSEVTDKIAEGVINKWNSV